MSPNCSRPRTSVWSSRPRQQGRLARALRDDWRGRPADRRSAASTCPTSWRRGDRNGPSWSKPAPCRSGGRERSRAGGPAARRHAHRVQRDQPRLRRRLPLSRHAGRLLQGLAGGRGRRGPALRAAAGPVRRARPALRRLPRASTGCGTWRARRRTSRSRAWPSCRACWRRAGWTSPPASWSDCAVPATTARPTCPVVILRDEIGHVAAGTRWFRSPVRPARDSSPSRRSSRLLEVPARGAALPLAPRGPAPGGVHR